MVVTCILILILILIGMALRLLLGLPAPEFAVPAGPPGDLFIAGLKAVAPVLVLVLVLVLVAVLVAVAIAGHQAGQPTHIGRSSCSTSSARWARRWSRWL